MTKKTFSKDELILVDIAEKADQEKWVPGIYGCELPNGNHIVDVTIDGERVERAYPTKCIKHSDEAYMLSVKFEVYVDSYRMSDVETFEGIGAEDKARQAAEEWAGQEFCPPSDDIVIDRVVVGGIHRFAVREIKK